MCTILTIAKLARIEILHKIERGSKIVKYKIATKIKDLYTVNFVGLKGGNKIVKHKIATKIQ